MTFFDTCIWIELVAANPPVTPKEIKQASLASEILKKVLQDQDQIITCREQLLEIISAVQKYKMREYNRSCKNNSTVGAGNLKEFRQTTFFTQTQNLCRQVCSDILHMAKHIDLDECDLEKILDSIHLVDINDYIYYEYCCSHDVDFYTFDGDFGKMEASERIHILS